MFGVAIFIFSNMAAVTSRANQQFGDSSHRLNFDKFRNTADQNKFCPNDIHTLCRD